MDEFRTARDFQTLMIEELLVILEGLKLPKSIFNKQRLFLEQMLAKRKAGISLSEEERKTLNEIRNFFNNIKDDYELNGEDIKNFIDGLKELEEDNCDSLPYELKTCKKNNYECKIRIKDVRPFINIAAGGRKLCDAIKEEDKSIQLEENRERIAIGVIVILMLLLFWGIAGIVYAATEDMEAFWWVGGIFTGLIFISYASGAVNNFQTTR